MQDISAEAVPQRKSPFDLSATLTGIRARQRATKDSAIKARLGNLYRLVEAWAIADNKDKPRFTTMINQTLGDLKLLGIEI